MIGIVRNLDTCHLESGNFALGRAALAFDDSTRVPHPAAGRRGSSGNKGRDSFGHVFIDEGGRLFFGVPADLSVAGFDDAPVSRFVWPTLTTVFQPAYDLAYAATDMLLELLKTPKLSRSQQFAHRLVCRASTGPFRPRAVSSPAAGG